MTPDPAPEELHHGGCLCGAIRFTLTGPAVDALTCHCTQCRRQTGAPFAAFVNYAVEKVRMDRGKPAVYRASPEAARSFCAICGSTLFWRGDTDAVVGIHLGAIDVPDAMPVPVRQVFAAHPIGWLPTLPGHVISGGS